MEHCLGAKALAIRKLDGPKVKRFRLAEERSDCIILAVYAEWNEADEGASDGEGGTANLVVICIIPCPCPPGKDPRAPQVTHLFDGKSSCFRFTFNQLSHFLRLLCDCYSVPLSLIDSNLA
jgi:hypothetical protein